MRSRSLALWIVLAWAVACDGASLTVDPAPDVDAVELDPPDASLTVGDTLRVTARPRTADGRLVTGKAVTWASQTEELASVAPFGSQGRVTATRAGTAVITASAGGKTGQIAIDTANPAPSVSFLEPEVVEAGVSELTLVVRGQGFVAESGIRWNGTDRPTAFVDPTWLRATIAAEDVESPGSAAVTVVTPAPGGGTSQALTFTVAEPAPPPTGPVASVEIDADSVALAEGASAQLTATARDAGGDVVPGRFVHWTSSDPEVAHVGALGAVTGIRSGTVQVTARVDRASTSIPARIWADDPFELLYGGWDGTDPLTMRVYATDLGDGSRTPVRVGPDAPSGGAVPSPDGSRLAYLLLEVGGWRRLMVANRDGTGAVELHRATDPGCGQPTWSPDGGKVAFGCRIGDGDLDIWVADVQTRTLVNLTDGHPGHQEWPSWSPTLGDGTSRIAYAQFVDGEPQIWTMKADGSDPRRLTSGIDRQPAWSPDGTTIAFQRTGVAIFGDIWVADPDGGNERGLVGLYLAGAQGAPSWSPDSRLLAFGSTHETYGIREPLKRQVYTVWADGSKLARRSRGDLATAGASCRLR